MKSASTDRSVRASAGSSSLGDTAAAFDDLRERLDFSNADLVLLFVAPDHDLATLSQRLSRLNCPVLCCTTAGELASAGGYLNGSIAGASITGVSAAVTRLDRLARFSHPDAHAAAKRTLEQMRGTGERAALMLLDGLCGREEVVSAEIHAALGGIPLAGGSAGDDGRFERTYVYSDGEFRSDTGVLAVLQAPAHFAVFQTHHFQPRGERVVVTDADPDARLVRTLNGIPAARLLADTLRIPVEKVGPGVLARTPLMRRVGDSFFVRGVRDVHPDGSLSLFCSVEVGDVLHLAQADDLANSTREFLEGLAHHHPPPELVIGFDCICRRAEMQLRPELAPAMNRSLAQTTFVGFSTYGEQYCGMHVNQTMTGMLIGGAGHG